MKDSLDQQDAHSPRPSTGCRHAAQSGGKARSKMRRMMERAAPAVRLSGAGRILLPDNIATTLTPSKPNVIGLSENGSAVNARERSGDISEATCDNAAWRAAWLSGMAERHG
jgi:hypothetical protein